jgi:hypothetical protein
MASPNGPADARGPRLVSTEVELAAPVWRCETFDWADYGVDFTTTAGRVFTVSWDRPGWHEGIWIREIPARGSAFEEDADVAIWDVSEAGRWDQYVGQVIRDVQMHYRPWAPRDGYWCSRITLLVKHSLVHVLLGDQGEGQQLAPAADNIAVVFPPNPLPEWERYEESNARPLSSS